MRTVNDELLPHALNGRAEAFRYNRTALTGGPGNLSLTFGELPSTWHASFSRADYAAYSYSTPIAWHIEGEGWVMPSIRYSVTTTQHQYAVAHALGLQWSNYGPGADAVRKGRGKSPYGPRSGGS